MNFILGSSSPRRLELLESIGIKPFKVVSPHINEDIYKNERPLDYCKRITIEKANILKDQFPNDILLTADTIAFCGRRIIDKTSELESACNHLKILSGRRHKVATTICVKDSKNKLISKTVTTVLNFKRLTKVDIENYLKTDEWQGVAGSYRIQGYASSFIKSINGSYTNVVGLPLYETKNLLLSVGVNLKDSL